MNKEDYSLTRDVPPETPREEIWGHTPFRVIPGGKDSPTAGLQPGDHEHRLKQAAEVKIEDFRIVPVASQEIGHRKQKGDDRYAQHRGDFEVQAGSRQDRRNLGMREDMVIPRDAVRLPQRDEKTRTSERNDSGSADTMHVSLSPTERVQEIRASRKRTVTHPSATEIQKRDKEAIGELHKLLNEAGIVENTESENKVLIPEVEEQLKSGNEAENESSTTTSKQGYVVEYEKEDKEVKEPEEKPHEEHTLKKQQIPSQFIIYKQDPPSPLYSLRESNDPKIAQMFQLKNPTETNSEVVEEALSAEQLRNKFHENVDALRKMKKPWYRRSFTKKQSRDFYRIFASSLRILTDLHYDGGGNNYFLQNSDLNKELAKVIFEGGGKTLSLITKKLKSLIDSKEIDPSIMDNYSSDLEVDDLLNLKDKDTDEHELAVYSFLQGHNLSSESLSRALAIPEVLEVLNSLTPSQEILADEWPSSTIQRDDIINGISSPPPTKKEDSPASQYGSNEEPSPLQPAVEESSKEILADEWPSSTIQRDDIINGISSPPPTKKEDSPASQYGSNEEPSPLQPAETEISKIDHLNKEDIVQHANLDTGSEDVIPEELHPKNKIESEESSKEILVNKPQIMPAPDSQQPPSTSISPSDQAEGRVKTIRESVQKELKKQEEHQKEATGTSEESLKLSENGDNLSEPNDEDVFALLRTNEGNMDGLLLKAMRVFKNEMKKIYDLDISDLERDELVEKLKKQLSKFSEWYDRLSAGGATTVTSGSSESNEPALSPQEQPPTNTDSSEETLSLDDLTIIESATSPWPPPKKKEIASTQ
jgi:hypothetical protein